jgi:hypothetical protein
MERSRASLDLSLVNELCSPSAEDRAAVNASSGGGSSPAAKATSTRLPSTGRMDDGRHFSFRQLLQLVQTHLRCPLHFRLIVVLVNGDAMLCISLFK